MEECIFCKIAKKDIKSEIIKESGNFIAFKDIHPITENHLLIISKEHYKNLLDLPSELGNELIGFQKEIASELISSGKCTGFNIMMNNNESAGQVVMHAHIHLIPRKEGDNIKLIAK